MPEKNPQSVTEVYPEQAAELPDQPPNIGDTQLETILGPEFRIVTRSLSQIRADERPIKSTRKPQEVRQKIREVQVQRRAAGDPMTSIRQVNKNRRR
jgi:hypothetical protein